MQGQFKAARDIHRPELVTLAVDITQLIKARTVYATNFELISRGCHPSIHYWGMLLVPPPAARF
jgi:hypothetical protein